MKSLGIALIALLIYAASPAPSPYFPIGYENVFIGMTKDSLIKTRGNHFRESRSPKGELILHEAGSADSLITRAMYFISPQDSLYEVIIEFADFFDLNAYMNDTYGAPNLDGEEWLMKLENGKELYIWQYLNRLCIAKGDLYK